MPFLLDSVALDKHDLVQLPDVDSAVEGALFDALEDILDDLRTRYDETPQWEFCEGFMAALICCRRALPVSEYLPLLLALDLEDLDGAGDDGVGDGGSFASSAQFARFMALWMMRWDAIVRCLDTPVESLSDEAAYQPEMLDTRGAIACMSEAERAELPSSQAPAYGQIWALGFMFAVESWPQEWAAPRDRDAAKWLDDALTAIVALTEDDIEEPTLCVYQEDGPPSVSAGRINALGDAIWAVYDLRNLWRSFGPRIAPVRAAITPGRNDACDCGSGKKYKKCCGA